MLKQKLSKFMSVLSALMFLFPLISNSITYAETQNETLITEMPSENEKIVVDFALSIGNNCAGAHYLRENNLRFQSSPLDWMFGYSLKTVNHLFKTEFKDFFKNVEIDKKKTCGIHRIVYDRKNHIESRHHYMKNVPFAQERKRVDSMMKKRAINTINTIKKSKSIALISRRNSSDKEFIQFIKEFSKIYPNKKIYLINVKNGKCETPEKRIIYNKDNLKVIEYKFINEGKKYPRFDGNPNGWAKVMETIKLSKEYKNSLPKQGWD